MWTMKHFTRVTSEEVWIGWMEVEEVSASETEWRSVVCHIIAIIVRPVFDPQDP